MPHLVLLGDSIFDNAQYVPDRPAVIEQVRRSLPGDWRASLLAVDGHILSDVSVQLRGVPTDATHLCVSVGGNDALGESHLLAEPACTVADALELLAPVQQRFEAAYRTMLHEVLAIGKPAAVCTIYDAIPYLEIPAVAALSIFNDVILREAIRAGIPVIDLRLICTSSDDFSPLSPIEPSHLGGAKIARAVADVALHHDFGAGRTTVYM